MPETDPFQSADSGYSITVAGNMNPAIHHPAWYKIIGALSDVEIAASGAVGDVKPVPEPTEPSDIVQGGLFVPSPTSGPVLTPAFTAFTAGKLRIVCVQQNWTISTYERETFTRACEVACNVFAALPQTPVSAYGFNFNFHRKVGTANVASRLAQLADAVAFDFLLDRQGDRSATLHYSLNEGPRTLNISLEPSVRGSQIVFVGINAHHPIVATAGTLFQQFDLEPLLRDHSSKDLPDAEAILMKLLLIFEGNGKH